MSSRQALTIIGAILVVATARSAHAQQEPPVAPTEEQGTPATPPPLPLPGELRIDDGSTPPPLPPPTLGHQPKKKKNIGVAARAHGGVGQRRLFDNSVLGANLTAGFGLYVDNVDIVFDLQMLFGSSEGLPTRQIMFGPVIDFEAFSRVRFGAGLSFGGTTVTRATNDSTMSAFSVGASVVASVDVWKLEGRTAFYVLGQLSVASAGPLFEKDSRKGVSATSTWGPTVAAGIRF